VNLIKKIAVLFFLIPFALNVSLKAQEVTPEKFKEWKIKAEKGDASAQSKLGACYLDGKGVTKNQVEAVEWFRKAAEQGDEFGQCGMGICYKNGYGVNADTVEAIKWFRKAANQGNALGQSSLGFCYQNGIGVAKDYVEAVKWYQKSADQGNSLAQHNLGICYSTGEGVIKDLTEAYAYFNLSGVTHEDARKSREIIEQLMTPSQIETGEKRSKELKLIIEEKINKPK
jgi:TPR repeat protein